jgi:hypothetical protein
MEWTHHQIIALVTMIASFFISTTRYLSRGNLITHDAFARNQRYDYRVFGSPTRTGTPGANITCGVPTGLVKPAASISVSSRETILARCNFHRGCEIGA